MSKDAPSKARQPDIERLLKVASLNLYHWATPEIGWYAPTSRHTPDGWAAKTGWLEETLARIDADVIGFQEVVSVAHLRTLMAKAGYPHFATVDEPHFSAEDPNVYNRPVQAIASKYPVQASRATPPRGVAGALGLNETRDFRRAPIEARVALPGLGETICFVAHLKSPGVGVGDALIAGQSQPPEAPVAAARWTLEALSRAHCAASIQRVFEASALYHLAAERIAEKPQRPVLIMGDLNDEPDSPALRALTAYRPFERDGAAEQPDEDAAPVDCAQQWRMIDAQRLSPRLLWSDERRATHRAGAKGDPIDFILVSSALQAWCAHAVGMVIDFAVVDSWFRRCDPAAASDHAAVVVAIAPFV